MERKCKQIYRKRVKGEKHWKKNKMNFSRTKMLFDVERDKDGNCSKWCSKCQSAYISSPCKFIYLISWPKLNKNKTIKIEWTTGRNFNFLYLKVLKDERKSLFQNHCQYETADTSNPRFKIIKDRTGRYKNIRLTL